MERKNANYQVKKEARRLFEVEGLSDKKVGEQLGFHGNTIAKWRQAEGWAARGTVPAEAFDQPDTPESATIGSEVTGEFSETATNFDEVEELKSRILDLEKKNKDLAAETERLRPDVDITAVMYQNEDDFARVFDEQHWKDRAQLEWRSVNQKRRLDGLEPIVVDGDELEDTIRRLKQEELASRNKPADGPADKRIKLVKPNPDGSYFPPHIVSIPYESQVNNVAGSLADGLVRYTQKGFKLTNPFLCPRRACMRPAAMDYNNEWAFDGYCSEEHRLETEKPQNANPVPGVTIRDAIGAVSG